MSENTTDNISRILCDDPASGIHIVGEYANMMVLDCNEALRFFNDYFRMNYKKFLSLYFSGERAAEIEQNIIPKNTDSFLKLSGRQREMINDGSSKYIVVSEDPGSGKIKVLVQKPASLMLLKDVKTLAASCANIFKGCINRV